MKRLFAVAVMASLASSCKTAPEPKPAEAQAERTTPVPPALQLPESTYLSPEVRALIRDRMDRHAEQMTFLLVGIVLLNVDATAAFAEEIANEPKLARPGPEDEDTVNALIPRRMFDLQDELAKRAQDLATQAKNNPEDVEGISRAYGRVTETCIRCHAAYLYPPEEETTRSDL